ncbi:hypothetical protein KSX_63320 [Ktedonospora formicarum]|uniref:Uncharacterized protein n=1 Tax=Ktedonospora formicarum TaxID=2778364 RepID=A0A8J3I9W4_9CHLR|nr:hypothetical protein KSX_63320 [Ktedonospora formicarum]
MKVWPESGHIGILAELNWRGSDGDRTVRLLVAPDIVVVAECDADPRQIKDDTTWRLTLPWEYAEWQARNAFKEWLPRKAKSSHDPQLACFKCAKTQVMNVGGVRDRHDV